MLDYRGAPPTTELKPQTLWRDVLLVLETSLSASGIKAAANALGGNADNGFVNGLFGNDISAISNIFFGADPGAAATGLAITQSVGLQRSLVRSVNDWPDPKSFSSPKGSSCVTSGGEYFGTK